jgi:NAD(P)-dependent dehydrogenase (short-subunit alcohol dehydrogenase family)
LEAGQKAAEDIIASIGNTNVQVARLDLADRASIAAFVANWSWPLYILVDNAGIMASPELRTAQGWELYFATNHLGHLARTTGLHDALAAAGHARVVVGSSVAHINGNALFDDINFEKHPSDRGRPTASPRRRTSASPWRPPGAGLPTASRSMR